MCWKKIYVKVIKQYQSIIQVSNGVQKLQLCQNKHSKLKLLNF